jgi:hypothetical protein
MGGAGIVYAALDLTSEQRRQKTFEALGCCRAHASAPAAARRNGLRCLNVELSETEIDTLIRKGF